MSKEYEERYWATEWCTCEDPHPVEQEVCEFTGKVYRVCECNQWWDPAKKRWYGLLDDGSFAWQTSSPVDAEEAAVIYGEHQTSDNPEQTDDFMDGVSVKVVNESGVVESFDVYAEPTVQWSAVPKDTG